MVVEYLKILANNSKAIFQEMTNTPVVSTSVKREQRLTEHYALALTMGFRDQNSTMDGKVLLGFGDPRIAVLVASSMAEHLGLPAVKGLNETALDILGEFLNTVVGHTVTGWEQAGLKVNFDPPATITQSNVDTYEGGPQADAYVIILNLSFGWLVFSVDFVDHSKQIKGKKVLVVDDSRLIRGLLSQALEQLGLTVVQAVDGIEALKRHREFQPDLTIMDLVMPRMGGLDAIIEIRERSPGATFIIMTSSGKQEERVTASTLDVSEFLIKPVKVDQFLDAVRKALI